MKTLKLLYITIISSLLFTSCITQDTIVQENPDNYVTIESVISNYDLWYVDYNKTTGTADVPFFSRAFTVSLLNGNFYANNNIVDIGLTGNGYGVLVGEYFTNNGALEIEHAIDGLYDFNVVQISTNEIRLDDRSQNVSYYLVGYQIDNFDYDKLFYDNIEYFLQEYVAWERTAITDGFENIFDEERYLQFTPENTTTFYSSTDLLGTNTENINWDFTGEYIVYDFDGEDSLKGLELNYDNGVSESFELSIINDGEINLYHPASETDYTFKGRGFTQYLKGSIVKPVRNNNRKRTIIKRQKIERKSLK